MSMSAGFRSPGGSCPDQPHRYAWVAPSTGLLRRSMLSSGSTRNTAPLLKRREISLVNSREISRACRRGLAVSIFLLPPATMDPATFIENALFTITTAFALSRLLAIGTAKLADAFNPGVKLPDAEWNELEAIRVE